MTKQKTSFIIDDDFWRAWTVFVVNKTGSARKLSEEMGKALREYMDSHRGEKRQIRPEVKYRKRRYVNE